MKNSNTRGFKISFILVPVFLGMISPSLVLAWGGRGHAAICDAATHLVKSPELKAFLTRRTHIMTHLCNIPDIYWRDLGPLSEIGNPTHYFEPDLVGIKLQDIPTTNYSDVWKMLQGQPHAQLHSPVKSPATEIGTLWWRADQFYRNAIELGKKSKALSSPKDKSESQNSELPFNKTIYEMLVQMGVMGHFVGDASQPLHSTSNYDGYQTGHGGLHAYYEEAIVGTMDARLIARIVDTARNSRFTFLNENSTVAKMKGLALLAYSEIEAIQSKDHVLEKSQLDSKGPLVKKIPAKREDPSVTEKAFEPLILQQMARSAALLAQLWDEIYEKGGKPSVSLYESNRFPLQPNFIPPDYLESKM